MASIEKSRRQPDAEMGSGRAPWWQGPLAVLQRTRRRLFGSSGNRLNRRTRDRLRDKGSVVRAIRPDPSASWALVALRQRVLVGVVADKHRVYGTGRIRKIDR
ncbi:MAG TPA: hypothetical protein V6D22_16750 [Candidatus Obscuribacterales bacterium]